MADQLSPKPVIWVGSSRRDFRAMPKGVRSRIGYALYVAQCGGKHRDAKPLQGFGGAGVMEVVADHRGDTFPERLHGALCGSRFRVARVSEEIEDGRRDAEI
jgi:phage-related protein